MSNSKIADDPRIDPRIKALLGAMAMPPGKDVASREELLEQANSEEAKGAVAALKGFLELCDNEDIAPSTGLTVSTREFTSDPDGNAIKIQMIQPESSTPLPCVYYIHGGGMQTMSCFDGNYRAWGKIIAAQASMWRWSTSETRSHPARRPRWPLTPPDSTTAFPD